MRNSKTNTGQELYEGIMSDLSPIVKTLLGEAMGLKPKNSHKLNEMSDEMLNRAIVAAVDKGDFERAKKFSDYKKSDERKQNMEKAESVEQKNKPRWVLNIRDEKTGKYVEFALAAKTTKTYYGIIRIYGEFNKYSLVLLFLDLIKEPQFDIVPSIYNTLENDKIGITNFPGFIEGLKNIKESDYFNRVFNAAKIEKSKIYKSIALKLINTRGSKTIDIIVNDINNSLNK